MLRYFSLCHIVSLVIGSATCLIFKQSRLIDSLAIGWLMILVNFYLLYWLWRVVIFKKEIALASVIIVLKYTFLGFIAYKLLTSGKVDVLGFSFGIMTIVSTSVFYSFFHEKIENKLEIDS